MSCQDVNAVFRCSDSHKSADNPEGLVLKHIARCSICVTSGTTCPPGQREIAHVLQEDEPEKDCPTCKGVTPPETP
jgi:hypothetical protein